MSEIIRALKPFHDLKDPNNTIYDHLPYKKDIALVKESDVRMESGNVVKNQRLVAEEPIILNTNPLANARLNEFRESLDNLDYHYVVEELNDNELFEEESHSNPILTNSPVIEPVNAFADVDEEDDDYSFLHD